MVINILKLSFITATLVFFVTAIILRALKRRRAASIFELLASAFFVAFTSQYLVGLDYLKASTYNFEGWSRILIFFLSLVYLVNRVYKFVRYKQ